MAGVNPSAYVRVELNSGHLADNCPVALTSTTRRLLPLSTNYKMRSVRSEYVADLLTGGELAPEETWNASRS